MPLSNEMAWNSTCGSARTLAENSSCRIQVTGIEALYQEYQTKGLLASNAAVRAKPWGTREFVVFD
jgi:hypothetical protein